MRHAFETTGPIEVVATMRSSDLVLTVAEAHDSAAVVEVTPVRGGEDVVRGTRVELIGQRLHIEVPKTVGSLFRPSGSVHVEVQVPLGSSLTGLSGSGDIRCHGVLARADIKSGSGDVTVDHAEDAEVTIGSGDVAIHEAGAARVTSGSGDVRLGRVAARSHVRTGSGDVSVASVTDLSMVTGSGDAVVDDLMGSATLTSGSGDLQVRRVVEGEVTAKAASGDVVIGVAAGTAAMLDVSSISGRVSSDLSAGDAPTEEERGVVLRLRSVSGDVRVQRA